MLFLALRLAFFAAGSASGVVAGASVLTSSAMISSAPSQPYFLRSGGGGRRNCLDSDDSPFRTLPRPRIGMGSLAARRQALAMTQSPITTQVHQALDVHRHFASQVAFDLAGAFNHLANPFDLVLVQILGPGHQVDSRRRADVVSGFLSDPVNVLKRDDDPLLRRQVDSGNASHLIRSLSSRLSLALFVARVRRADHPHHSLAPDHLALITDFLH